MGSEEQDTVYVNPHRELFRLAWSAEAAGRIWAITPEAFAELRRQMIEAMDNPPKVIETEAAGRKPGRPPNIQGGVQVVSLSGVLMGSQMSLLEMFFGIESGLNAFRNSFRQAAQDPNIGAIVMDVDSPGGLVDQIPETAAMIREAAKTKTVVAVANTLAASGAYWLASQANEIAVTPSGEVGSIGVYATHMDLSGALEQQGVKVTLVSAGKYKTETSPYAPLDDEARAALQASVDDYYGMFTKDVAAGRQVRVSEVVNGFGEGRTLTAKRAVDAGLADRVASLDDVVAGLQRRTGSSGEAAAAEDDKPEPMVEDTEVEVETEDEAISYTAEERMRLVHTLANLGAR